MKRRLRAATLIAVLGAVFAVPAATAATVTAEIGKKATLVDGGAAVIVEVSVACSPGSEVLEAFVYVVQDDNTSQFAGIPVVCDGTLHTYTVRVRALDFVFRKGKARASAYILLESGEQTSPTRIIKIHKR